MFKINKTISLALAFFFTSLLLTGCSKHYEARGDQEKTQGEVIEEEAVDCLLPGTIRKLGQHMVYTTPPRHIKTSAQDCKIRGGKIEEAKEASDKETYREE